MKCLLDTHTAIWALTGNDKMLSERVKNIIADRTAELTISIASIWELAIKISKNSTITGVNGVTVFIDKLRDNGVNILGITDEEVIIVETLPFIHKDPFDRIIIATAINNGLTLISTDNNIQKYNVQWVW